MIGSVPLAVVFAFTRILSMSAAEWTAVIGAMGGVGVLSTLITGAVSLRRLKLDEKAQPITLRTVAADEAEATVRMQAELVNQYRRQATEEHERAARCDRWQREHRAICPMWRDTRTADDR